jgi:uncharacterized protein (TIGR00369 family)
MPRSLEVVAQDVIQRQPFSIFMGASLEMIDSGICVLLLPILPNHLQQDSIVHGGAICYLADNAITFAGGSSLGPRVVTSELKINYLRPAAGDRLVARAVTLHASNRQATCRCDVYAIDGGEERWCATALGTVVARHAPIEQD